MQRINSIYDWVKMEIGEAMDFASDLPDQRPVRVSVNAPSPAALWFQQGVEMGEDGEEKPAVTFLASVNGLDEIQFQAVGDFTLFCTGGEVWFHTLDGERGDVEPVDETSFTTIVTRRARNLEREIIEHTAQQNIERRLAAMQAGFDAKLAEIKATNVDQSKVADDASKGTPPAKQDGSEGTPVGDDAGNGGNDGK